MPPGRPRSSSRLLRALCACAAVAALPGCEGSSEALEEPSAERHGAFLDRDRVLGPFLSQHWELPVPLQGDPPRGFPEAEASLDPAACGTCHPLQYQQWQTSLHAAAFSPGFAGQLIEGELAEPHALRECQTCHAPLEEQQPFSRTGLAQEAFQPELRSRGIVCVSCHVRAHRRFGPPRRTELPPVPEPVPHAGFEARPEFQISAFCSPCHQFFDDPGVEEKPVENTFAEWSASPQARSGRTCQQCHMPDRAHLWRGIHDPPTVREAIDVGLEVGDAGSWISGALRITNRDVGHAFPTYVTPRVLVSLHQADARGSEISDTREEGVIGREIDFSVDPWQEVLDTRVLPGETVELLYERPLAVGAHELVGTVTVDPDYHYRGLFESLVETLGDPGARALVGEALRRISTSRYVLVEIRRPLGPGAGD